MKYLFNFFLLTLLMSMVGAKAFAYDAWIDGIFYNFSGSSATVTFHYSPASHGRSYSGNVIIPESVTYNGNTYSVTSIGLCAFYGCSSLTSVTIPNSVTSIDGYAFKGCFGLTSVTIPNSVTSIGSSAFSGCSGLTNVTIGNSVTSIGSSAFEDCSCLTSVTIPNSVTSIGEYVFSNCYGLTSVTIPNSVTSIGGYAFSNCSSLVSVTIPNSVTSIGDYAFSGCSSLTSVTIPNSVTSIGGSAFSNCSILSSVTIGAGVLTIGAKVFDGHQPAKVIWLTNTPPSGYSYAAGTMNYVANNLYTALSNKTVYKFLSSLFEVGGVRYVPVSPSDRTCDAIDCRYDAAAENIHIGNTVTNQGVTLTVMQVQPYAFYGNPHVQDVDLSFNGNVGDYAFYGCSNINKAVVKNSGNMGDYTFSHISGKGTFTADIDNSGTIGSNAFIESTKLTILEIGGNVTNIGENAFKGCKALKTATLGERISSLGVYAFSGCSSLKAVIIPNSVKTIGEYAFQNCSAMETVKMGSGVTSIAQETFSGCSSLTDMQIGNNVKTIYTYVFSGCNSLPTIRIPRAVTNINNYVFYNCNSLKTVIMEDRELVLKLGSNGSSPLFSGCPLDSVYIGGDISYSTSSDYGYSPFYRNTSLRSVMITDKETEISENEFYGCTNLKNVYIGDGVTTIGNWAFSGCSSLDYFAFGSSVKTIGKEAFSDCVSVTKIISKAATPPACGSQALDDINKWTCVLMVPEGNVTAYQAADQWKEFFFIEEVSAGIPELRMEQQGQACIYSLNGKKLDRLQKGLNIVVMEDGSVRKVVK